ncbi:MAG: T9SS type A sorting domain-containing protein [Fibrobacter sp.]|nr:T9SS type A sorting domain-containing protein [Fibrobacter sp.]
MKDIDIKTSKSKRIITVSHLKIILKLVFLPCFVNFVYSNETWDIILELNDNKSNVEMIYDIKLDELNKLWLGFDRGLGVYSNNVLKRYDSSLIKHNYISICIDNEDHIWTFNDKNGVTVFKDTSFAKVNIESDELPKENITDIFQASDGTYWIIVYNGGVFSSNNLSNWTNHYPSLLPINKFRKILEDNQKRIWIYSMPAREVACFDGTVWSIYDSTNSPLRMVWTIAADSSGNIWFSSVEEVAKPQHGLFKFDGENWTQYNSENSNLPYNDSYGMVVDRAGYLWLITAKCDFLRFTGDTFEIRDNSYFPRGGAAADNMLVDYRNRIVIGFRHKPILIYDQHKDDCGSVTRIDMHVPKEGKEYKAGTTLPILWATVGCIDSVTIEYRTGSSEWQKIAGPVLNRMPYHWTVPSTLSSQYQIRVSKSDEPEINAVSSHFNVISNTANNPPEFIDPPDTITIAPNSTFTWTVSVRDPDNDPVTLSFENITDWMSVSGNELTFTPLAGDTDTVITVTASDNNDGEKTISVCVLVRPPVSVSKIKKKQLNLKTDRIEIFDFRGKRLKVMENSAYLKKTGLSSGSYILKKTTEKSVSYRKFVVNNR